MHTLLQVADLLEVGVEALLPAPSSATAVAAIATELRHKLDLPAGAATVLAKKVAPPRRRPRRDPAGRAPRRRGPDEWASRPAARRAPDRAPPGHDRYLLTFHLDHLLVTALCLSAALLATTRRRRLRLLTMGFSAGFAVAILGASRSGILVVVAVVGTTALTAFSNRRRILMSIAVAGGALALLSSNYAQTTFGIRIVPTAALLWDDARLDLIYAAIDGITAGPGEFLFGVGWGSSRG